MRLGAGGARGAAGRSPFPVPSRSPHPSSLGRAPTAACPSAPLPGHSPAAGAGSTASRESRFQRDPPQVKMTARMNSRPHSFTPYASPSPAGSTAPGCPGGAAHSRATAAHSTRSLAIPIAVPSRGRLSSRPDGRHNAPDRGARPPSPPLPAARFYALRQALSHRPGPGPSPLPFPGTALASPPGGRCARNSRPGALGQRFRLLPLAGYCGSSLLRALELQLPSSGSRSPPSQRHAPFPPPAVRARG